MSRSILELNAETKQKYFSFAEGMKAENIDFIITCTGRSPAEQEALYAKGRTKPGKIVTWTLKSKHIEGKAFDICIMENGVPDWNVSNPDWTRAGEIGVSVGLIWGGNFKTTKDFPHFETV